jgi:hypothetical protein
MTLIGNVIDSTYVGGQKAGKKVTQADLAAAALEAQSKFEVTARDTVNSYFTDAKVVTATMIMLYNASGAPLVFRSTYDDSGHIGQYPYDTTIGNGQWSCVLHVHASGSEGGSVGAYGYTVDDPEQNGYVALLVWNSPYNHLISGLPTAFGDCWSSGGYGDTKWSSIIGYGESGGSTGAGNRFGAGKYRYTVPYGIGQNDAPILRATVQWGE